MFMQRLYVAVALTCFAGCSQPGNSARVPVGDSAASAKTIKHGRVTLRTHKIEAGAPNPAAVQSGLDTATSVIDDLLATDELKPAAGTFVGRFRLEPDGKVRMFLTDGSTSITNVDASKLEDAFVAAAFAGKCSFPVLGDIAMVYAEFTIAPLP